MTRLRTCPTSVGELRGFGDGFALLLVGVSSLDSSAGGGGAGFAEVDGVVVAAGALVVGVADVEDAGDTANGLSALADSSLSRVCGTATLSVPGCPERSANVPPAAPSPRREH
ncbi:hypothetical protein [Amycolatopsis sp. WGS_07]|uniref:hypothetical protein n=1 Tax=Amycolatopsis sp. WGS_07 TaxID=3076764 RepID=UPI003872C615